MMSALSQYVLQWQHYFHELGLFGMTLYVLVLVLLGILCVPLSPLSIAGGLIFGFGPGFFVVHLGTTLGAAVNFFMARYLARERVSRWLSHHEKFRLIDAAIGREGWKIIALLRFCPIPFGIANYSYGLTAVRFVPYLVATTLAIIPANVFFVWFGTTSNNALSAANGTAKAPPGQIIFTIIGLIAFFIALTYVTKVARAAVARKDPTAAPQS